MAYKAELVLDAKATLGEGPHWDHLENRLYWVDIIGKKLHTFDPVTNENRTLQFDHYIGAAVPGKPGQLILAMQNGIYRYEIESKLLTLIADPESDKPNNRFNDGKCDPTGRFYVGTMDLNGKKGSGALYRLDRDGQLSKMLSSVTISNGLAWSPDGNELYFIDTPTGEVAIYHYNQQSGDLIYKQPAVKIPQEMGSPDGMTIDQEGMIWVAHWGGSRVTRWDPQLGNQLDEVIVPAKNVTSCAFGGENLDELYITTARQGMNDDELLKFPQSGGLFKVKTGVQGVRGNHYRSSK